MVLPAVGVSAAVGRRRDEEGEDTCVFTAQLDKKSVKVRTRMREIICVYSQCVTCVEFVLLYCAFVTLFHNETLYEEKDEPIFEIG